MKQHLVCAQFIDTYFPVIDGVVRTVSNYAKYLNNGEDYCCVVAPKSKGYVDAEPFDVYRTLGMKIPFMGYSLSMPEISRKTRQALDGIPFNLYHAHSPFGIGHYALHMAHKHNIPIISTFHSKYYDDFKRILKSEYAAQIGTDYIVRFYNKVDAVWACNHGTAQTLREYGYQGEIFVMNNGSDYQYPINAEEIKRKAFEKYPFTADEFVILFVGHLIWQKNCELIIRTIALLKQRGKRVRMLFVGTGYHETEIRALATELELNDVITFVGQLSERNDLQEAYFRADLFFFPSVYDNAPLVVREAATMKLPALLTRGTNAAEGIIDGANGFTEEESPEKMADRIEQLMQDKQMLQTVGERASETIPVSWEEISKRVHTQYDIVMEEYRRKSSMQKRRYGNRRNHE